MNQPKVGDRVTIPWWEQRKGRVKPVHITLSGKIVRINGAYHTIRIDNNPKYDMLELYPIEFEVTNA
jgi:hypothetical protein